MISVKTIYINGRFLSRSFTGVDRYAYENILALRELNVESKNVRFVILAPRSCKVECVGGIPVEKVGIFTGHLWEQLELPFFARKGSGLISYCNTGPVFAAKNHVVVIHDAAVVGFPQSFGFKFRLWYRLLLPILGRSAKSVITVSDFSRQELAEKLHIPFDKIVVAHGSGEHFKRIEPDADFLAKQNLIKGEYILAVSSQAPHKNFKLILDAIQTGVECPVVIAGGANKKVFADTSIRSDSNVKWLGYVSDSQLSTLFKNARCFIFPSFYEGFGIPPLEAMENGCPVLASNSASIPEVCGDAALFFNPSHKDELLTKINEICKDEVLREAQIARGYQNSARFRWLHCCKTICAEVLDS